MIINYENNYSFICFLIILFSRQKINIKNLHNPNIDAVQRTYFFNGIAHLYLFSWLKYTLKSFFTFFLFRLNLNYFLLLYISNIFCIIILFRIIMNNDLSHFYKLFIYTYLCTFKRYLKPS